MKPRVYIETSFVSYLTSRPSRDIVVAGHQQVTREWRDAHDERFEVVASQLVAQEAATGDPKAAQRRLEILDQVEMLPTTDEAEALAITLVQEQVLPPAAADDALHLAIAVTNGVEYLLTWNCRHLANAALRRDIDQVCLSRGYQTVIVCTPEELGGE